MYLSFFGLWEFKVCEEVTRYFLRILDCEAVDECLSFQGEEGWGG